MNKSKTPILSPVRESRRMWRLEEELEYYSASSHGWKKVDSFTYVAPSKRAIEKLLADITKKRTGEGWIRDNQISDQQREYDLVAKFYKKIKRTNYDLRYYITKTNLIIIS